MVSLLLRILILSDHGSTLMASFNLNYLLRGPIQIQPHWGLGPQHVNWGSGETQTFTIRLGYSVSASEIAVSYTFLIELGFGDLCFCEITVIANSLSMLFFAFGELFCISCDILGL